jgi:NADH-quinone oxidoreductase subunit J
MEALLQLNLAPILYGLFCVLAVMCSVGVVMLRNPVSSAFSLIAVLISVAAIFAMQEAHFVAAVQILVYAGAIMVLFIFVIMLLNIERVELDFPRSKATIAAALLSAIGFFAITMAVFRKGSVALEKGQYSLESIEASGGNIRVISEVMFSDYILPFELIAMLLLMAIVGAIVLAKRKVE